MSSYNESHHESVLAVHSPTPGRSKDASYVLDDRDAYILEERRPLAGSRDKVVCVLDERRREALAESDNRPFKWREAKVCLVAGIGFFTDAYDLFAISLASTMLRFVYGTPVTPVGGGPTLDLSAQQITGIKIATLVGTIIGQLGFGYLADIRGRKRMYGFELLIIIVATFGQATSANGGAIDIISIIIVWRFIVGIGVGGDYPVSATITSEFAAIGNRGRMMTATFASQGWGQLSAAIVGVITVVSYQKGISSDSYSDLQHVDYVLRILIGLGCVPGCIALYFRMTIPESPRFTMDVERNVDKAVADINNILDDRAPRQDPDAPIIHAQAPRSSRSDFIAYFRQPKNMKTLFGTSYSWFAQDMAFYGLGLNSTEILIKIGFVHEATTGASVFNSLKFLCIGNILLSVAGLIPGYWVTFLLIDKIGRKRIQLLGFGVLTVLFIIMGVGYDAHKFGNYAMLVFYCITNFFQNFGPNTTTFIIPGEVFPTRYRSTAHGISAASGKLGAVAAQGLYALVQGEKLTLGHYLEILAAFMVTGILSTLLLPETKGKSLEDLSNEVQTGFITGPIDLPI